MFVKRDCFGGNWGQRVGDFFYKCKINEHTLNIKKEEERKGMPRFLDQKGNA